MLDSLLGRLSRYLRRLRAGWTADSDRAFHDQIFQGQDYDPFDPAYPGNITIRRFADLASEYVAQSQSVADLGCGPGEITCELARRFPAVAFQGWDHSEAAVTRARQLARAGGLTNVTFDIADLTAFRVPASTGLVTMFDSFHHLPDPRSFLTLNAHVPRWFLIEPAGDALGRWHYSLDLDWVLLELDKVRWRLDHELSTGQPIGPRTAGPGTSGDGGAVEFRYSLEDLTRMFAAYGVNVVGTTAGLVTYPPGPTMHSDLRPLFNDFAYRVLATVDAQLQATGEDLEARHWAVYCGKGERFPQRRRGPRRMAAAAEAIQGPYGVAYRLERAPERVGLHQETTVLVAVQNVGFLPWQSTGPNPFHLSYHWRDRKQQVVVADGLRTPFDATVASGSEVTATMRVNPPGIPGRYTLEIDLVHEGVTWLSQAGQPTLNVVVTVVADRQGPPD